MVFYLTITTVRFVLLYEPYSTLWSHYLANIIRFFQFHHQRELCGLNKVPQSALWSNQNITKLSVARLLKPEILVKRGSPG